MTPFFEHFFTSRLLERTCSSILGTLTFGLCFDSSREQSVIKGTANVPLSVKGVKKKCIQIVG